jgi:hypothetical protein
MNIPQGDYIGVHRPQAQRPQCWIWIVFTEPVRDANLFITKCRQYFLCKLRFHKKIVDVAIFFLSTLKYKWCSLVSTCWYYCKRWGTDLHGIFYWVVKEIYGHGNCYEWVACSRTIEFWQRTKEHYPQPHLSTASHFRYVRHNHSFLEILEGDGRAGDSSFGRERPNCFYGLMQNQGSCQEYYREH